MIALTKRFLVAFLSLILFATGINAQQTLDEVKKARGLNDNDILAAVKTFMPRGGRDEYFGFAGTGNSGTMIVYGIPSMRIYKYVGVFSPEPWQGYGFDDESMLMLKKGSLDDRIVKYGDMRYPAFSETGGKYNGKYLFYSDGANSRIALLGLDDFETKQILAHPFFHNCYTGVAVDQNTDYVVQSSQYPAPWDLKSIDVKDFKSGVTFWKFDDHENGKEGHHIGRLIKEKSFTVELPAYELGYFDTGREGSDGFVYGIAKKDGKTFVYVINYKALAGKADGSKNSMAIVSTKAANGNYGFIPVSSATKVKVTPDGKYLIVVADEVNVLDLSKVNAAVKANMDLASVKKSSFKVGSGVKDVAFEMRDNVAYFSAFNDSKVYKYDYSSGKKLGEVALDFKPSDLMVPQGLSADPHSNYLIAVDKQGIYKTRHSVGPIRPSFQHLIDISGDKMVDIYTMSLPQANVYGNVGIKRTTIKPVIRYPLGTNTRTGEISTFRTVAGQEKIERDPKTHRVHVFGTLIRSHITPEIVEVNEGDIVTFHLTNLERAEDETHGFTVDTYGKHGSFEPGKTASLTFVADRPGVFPYYCTEFCSALHLEMEGILLIIPKNYKGPKTGANIILTKEELAAYKKNYEDKVKVIAATGDIINGVVKWLKENHYEKYPYVTGLVEDALDQLGADKGGAAKEKYEKYAKEGKWKDAFLWAEQYWQYQVKTADVGLRAKKLLSEKIGVNQ